MPKVWESRPHIGAEGRGMGRRGCPPPQPTRGSGGASWAPTAGSGAEPRPKTNLVHFVAARRTLIAIIRIIVLYKGILSNDNPAICRMWSSVRCHAQGGTPRRNASLAFRLEHLQKFRYGVPPFQKVPVWRSSAFRLSLSTACSHFLLGCR